MHDDLQDPLKSQTDGGDGAENLRARALTLEWISEERVLTGGAAFDSQPSKG